MKTHGQQNARYLIALLAVVSLASLCPSPSDAHHQHHHAHQHSFNQNQENSAQQSSQQQGSSAVSALAVPSASHLCSGLGHELSRQLKLCKLIRHSPAANEAISTGTSKGLHECRQQFARERWNCTHSVPATSTSQAHHKHQQSLITSELAQSVGNKESGFLQAITAAGIVHQIAVACSEGSLTDCACDRSRVGLIKRHDDIWSRWGGCSNNIRHGMLYAKHMAELLDAHHEHQRLAKLSSTGLAPEHRLEKRALQLSRNLVQLRAGRPPTVDHDQEELEHPEFCRREHNLTRAVHFQLIKSLLSRNSLEKHQEIRLAMNMHNNKIGRMVSSRIACMVGSSLGRPLLKSSDQLSCSQYLPRPDLIVPAHLFCSAGCLVGCANHAAGCMTAALAGPASTIQLGHTR